MYFKVEWVWFWFLPLLEEYPIYYKLTGMKFEISDIFAGYFLLANEISSNFFKGSHYSEPSIYYGFGLAVLIRWFIIDFQYRAMHSFSDVLFCALQALSIGQILPALAFTKPPNSQFNCFRKRIGSITKCGQFFGAFK